jgi:hypothetical protein
MKRTLTIAIILLASAATFAATAPIRTITGNITGTVNWVADTIYLLQGKVYVKAGSTLNIAPGTIIKGDKATPGSALIITRGAKIMAIGTATKPIVFTSSAAKGARATADWGGLVLAGNAKINVAGGVAPFEGGNLANPDGNTDDGKYGGLNDQDNSGVLKYVRIEFAGFPYQTNSELNSLTLGGVGNGTEIDYVQCSFGFDDAFEFFGGSVNAKHLVAFRGNDDDFDTDFGYSGKIQFAVAFRDSAIADAVSGANSFESDNDASGTGASPFTNPIFSNVTIVGPKQTATTTTNAAFRSGNHVRRNSRLSLFNSVITGFPTGLKLDGDSCHNNADANLLEYNQVVIAGCPRLTDSTSGTAWSITNWYEQSTSGNTSFPNVADVMFTDSKNYLAPNLLPATGSPLLTGALFNNPKLSSTFFTPTTYKGAFGATNWMASWTSFDPNNEAYEWGYGVIPTNVNDVFAAQTNFVVSPNPATNNISLAYTLVSSNDVQINIVNAYGAVVKNISLGSTYGINNQNISISDLANGFYTITIKSNGLSTTQKLVINK